VGRPEEAPRRNYWHRERLEGPHRNIATAEPISKQPHGSEELGASCFTLCCCLEQLNCLRIPRKPPGMLAVL